MTICAEAVTLGVPEDEVWWRSGKEPTERAVMGPLLFCSLTSHLRKLLGLDILVICHSMAFMAALRSQMRGTIDHKGWFFMSYWAPSNSCMLFIPLILFSSLLMKSPMPLISARRCQAVQWIKCCLSEVQQLGMSLTVYIMNPNSIVHLPTSSVSE